MIAPTASSESVRTFLFTDIEDSTGHWQRLPEATRIVTEQHDAILRKAIEQADGHIFRTAGDAFYVSFESASAALRAAIYAQCGLFAAFPASSPLPIRVRMALHTGGVHIRDGDYFGLAPAGAARLLERVHGGQILLTEATAKEIDRDLPEATRLREIGERLLRSFVETTRLFQVEHPELPTGFPPIADTPIPTNLPRALTPFVGREREIGEIRHRVLSAPLVTLVGAGGCGKTRTATQTCEFLYSSFPDGIWLIDLTRIAEESQLAPLIAEALQIRLLSASDSATQIIAGLKDKRVLLLFDNCEHVLSAVAEMTAVLLRQLPRLHILATSREALNIPGEYRVPLRPLAVPDTGRQTDPVHLLQFDGVRLFLERIQAIVPDFRLTPENASSVIGICRRVDGIPLALIITAAWATALALPQIELRLNDRFRLLKASAPRATLPHHQTLRAAIDWSYALLTETEQTLLRRVSIFSGGWNLAAAEAVCGESPVEDVLTALMALVQKSLVQFEDTPDGGRYRLLETIREYALDQLEKSGESGSLCIAHRDYYLNWIRDACAHFYGPEAMQWLSLTDQEWDNIRSSLATTKERYLGLHFIASLFWFWHVRGHIIDGLHWIKRFVDRDDPISETEVAALARAHNGAGILYWNVNDLNEALRHFRESFALQRKLNNLEAAAGCLSNLGSIYMQIGLVEESNQCLKESLELFEATGNKARQAMVLVNLGVNEEHQGNNQEAVAFYERAIGLLRPLGPSTALATTLCNLANIWTDTNRIASAIPLFRESFELSREIGYRPGIANILHKFPNMLIKQSRLKEAVFALSAANAYDAAYGFERSDREIDELQRIRKTLLEAVPAGIFAELELSGKQCDIEMVINIVLGQEKIDE